ncbi:FAS1-like dehydratase domain-containing protein [Lacisediminimonas profundi]|uniref:FAS1-like dehydratase domain-containing protein n=1 Tax=Lacisediminimonas profundi TaxID=2603856 RepID=UPI00124B81B3|nr:MaoC family dehydratase N-terminal domain-containing protein [Lacisediminimonas profundi]
MDGDKKGQVLLRTRTRAHAVKIAEMEAMLGTPSASETARLVPFFGPTVAGEAAFVKALGLRLERALLGGHAIEFQRPFVPDELLDVELRLADYSEKNGMQFGTIETRFVTPMGEEIQVQTTTFIERT